ncbi:MAG TPA: hypothetical protein VGG73_15525 [Vicinamibacterales bacterium]|jgi:hypothetical protein
MRLRFAAILIVAGLITISCGGITDPSQNTVQTFSGTFSSASPSGQAFTAAAGGELTVKLTALAPVSSSYVGVAWVYQNSDGSCSTNSLFSNQFSQLNVPAISGAQISKGAYCIVVYDVVGFTTPETYTMTVSHP